MKSLARQGLAASWGGLAKLGVRPEPCTPVSYIVERGEGWSIRWDGDYYAQSVNALRANTVAVADRPERLIGSIAHFGSQFVWELWTKPLASSNRQLVTYFHGKPEDGPDMARHVDFFLRNLNRVERIITAATLMEQRLLAWGVPRAKLLRVPLGVDPVLFHPPTAAEKEEARREFRVPPGRFCIGSFQKDGVGWGEGMEPKLIKGPDLLVETAARLAKRFPIFVLLTGPARGYVKAGLERNGIAYHHVFLRDYLSVARAYRALDLYVMTSREEGGPKALLESLASGVPLVSTRVGMADDLFPDTKDVRMVQPGDLEGLTRAADIQLTDHNGALSLAEAGRKLALDYAWDKVGRVLLERAYAPLLKDRLP
ncbi:MAG: glycosyltransferase [Rhodospirillales bacterium]|nr:glycosyltransferase [Rhodospirillales bacterium]